MEPYFSILKQSSLFSRIEDAELASMLSCLSPMVKAFPKNSTVFPAGAGTDQLGLVLSGHISLEKEDFWGNRSIVVTAETGMVFGEVYACTKKPLPFRVRAASDCNIMFLAVQRLLTVCTAACPFHLRLVRNLLDTVAERASVLSEKMEHLTCRSTRDKLLSYLSGQARRQQSHRFVIPFDRQGLADYLAVERSAMCAVLSQMQREGLLEYHKNEFLLHTPAEPLE